MKTQLGLVLGCSLGIPQLVKKFQVMQTQVKGVLAGYVRQTLCFVSVIGEYGESQRAFLATNGYEIPYLYKAGFT